MSHHNEEKEVIEAALAHAASYRGVSLCTPAVTRVSDWILSDDGSITGPKYTVECPPSAQVKALIDASLDAVTPPVDVPVDPIEPPIDPVEPVEPPDPVLPTAEGSHTVKATVIDGAGIEWTASATVGNDASAAGQLVNLKNPDGVQHGGLQAMFYADCCHVSIQRCDYPYSEAGCFLTVTYDGQSAHVPPSSYPDGTVTFWRGSWMPAIRYGNQVPFDASKIDWSVLPNYAKEKQLTQDMTRFDWTFNAAGYATYTAMGAAGERGDIGFMATPYMAFITNPCEETWNWVRKCEDWSGNWGMAFMSDPSTGKILKNTNHPDVTLLSYVQVAFKDNPIIRYQGMKNGATITPPATGWDTSGNPHKTDVAHLTSYGMLASMITGAAHDKDLCSFWGNYPMIAANPVYYRNGAAATQNQRAFAWALRSIFIAAFHSSDTEYFHNEVARTIAIANAIPKNPFGILNTDAPYKGTGSAVGFNGVALWMQSYLAIVCGAVAQKFPEMVPFAQFLGRLEAIWFSKPYYMQRTIYSFICRNPDKSLMVDFDEMVRLSLISNGYTDDEATAIVSATTVEEAYAAQVVQWNRLNTSSLGRGKLVNGYTDFRSGITDPDSYPAGAIASVFTAANVGTTDIEQAVDRMNNLPTKIDFRSNQQNHIIKKD